jgi:hypothetical protein
MGFSAIISRPIERHESLQGPWNFFGDGQERRPLGAMSARGAAGSEIRECQIITVPYWAQFISSPVPSPRKRGEGDAKRRVRG